MGKTSFLNTILQYSNCRCGTIQKLNKDLPQPTLIKNITIKNSIIYNTLLAKLQISNRNYQNQNLYLSPPEKPFWKDIPSKIEVLDHVMYHDIQSMCPVCDISSILHFINKQTNVIIQLIGEIPERSKNTSIEETGLHKVEKF